jgi:hypothetical protein
VTTGTVPEPRAQAVWRLKQWFTEPAVIERNLRAAALAFGGDPAVVDCSRVMRLPGSVSYPKAKKPGRVAELVTVEYPEL